MDPSLGFSSGTLLNFLLFSLAFFVIFKHFIDSSKEDRKVQKNLDDLIREKKRTFEETLVHKNIVNQKQIVEDDDFFTDLKHQLQWGEVSTLSADLVAKEYKLKLAVKIPNSFISDYLTSDRLSKEDFIKELVVEQFRIMLVDRMATFQFDKRSYEELLLSLLILIDEKEKIFKKFDGTKKSIAKIKISNEDVSTFINKIAQILDKNFVLKWKEIMKEIENLFILKQNDLKDYFGRVSDKKQLFKELSMHYHPDRIPWRYIPASEKDRLMKVYTDHFSEIQNNYKN